MFTHTDKKEKPVMSRFHVIILSVVGSLILLIVLISICLTYQQHSKEQKRRKHALKQEERQAIEYEMTNLLNGSPRPGHLRAANTSSNTPRANGVIPGSSGKPSNDQSGLGKSMSGMDMYLENNIPALNKATDARYTRLLKIRDRGSPSSINENFPQIVREDLPSSPVCASASGAFGFDRSRIKKQESDKYKLSRPRTPSPRPDVIQEEKATKQYYSKPRYTRALSAEMLVDDVSRADRGRLKRQYSETGYSNQQNEYLPYSCHPSTSKQYNIYSTHEASKSLPHLNRNNTHKQSPSISENEQSFRAPPDVKSSQFDPGYRTTVTQLISYDRSPPHSSYHQYANYMPPPPPPPPPEEITYINTQPKTPTKRPPPGCVSYQTVNRPVHETHFPSIVDYEEEPTVYGNRRELYQTEPQSDYTSYPHSRPEPQSDYPNYPYSRTGKSEVRHAPV